MSGTKDLLPLGTARTTVTPVALCRAPPARLCRLARQDCVSQGLAIQGRCAAFPRESWALAPDRNT
eukprot:4184932-Alexandrium_andersonii.AAC.1